jgi:hypothetical protein
MKETPYGLNGFQKQLVDKLSDNPKSNEAAARQMRGWNQQKIADALHLPNCHDILRMFYGEGNEIVVDTPDGRFVIDMKTKHIIEEATTSVDAQI